MHGHDRVGTGHPGERRADRLRYALVKLVGHDPSDVVRLDDARKITQCGTCPPVTRPVPPRVVRAALPSLSVLRRPGAQHPQVAPAADLDPLPHGLLLGPHSRRRLHHRVRERLQVVGAVLDWLYR